jgi:ubiquitin carboxyl-terminal hydrolase 22/27/51
MPPTLNGCLDSFTSPEKLMADVYNCSGCGNTPQKATKQLKIKKLPAILCMQLKVSLFLVLMARLSSVLGLLR